MQFYQLSQTSLAKSGSSVVEEYIPLWMADGTTASSNLTSAGNLLGDGGTAANFPTSYSQTKLFTLNSNWNPNQQYAFECTLYGGGFTVYASLWDITSNVQVNASQISVSSTTATIARSTKFALTPGHSYGVSIWVVSGSTVYITDANLIVFGQ